MMNRFSGPGTSLGFMSEIEEAAWVERRTNPSPIEACDDCFRRFRGAPPKTPNLSDFEEEDAEDARERFKHCSSCDWTICEDCTKLENQVFMFLMFFFIRQVYPTLIAHLGLAAVQHPTLA
jgi:hypothetical protein